MTTPTPEHGPELPVVAWMTVKTLDGKKKLERGECSTNPRYPEVHKEWAWEPLVKLSDAQAAIQAAVPVGFRLVPVEPTEAMLRPFWECPPDELRLAWEAMLIVTKNQIAASPTPPATELGQQQKSSIHAGCGTIEPVLSSSQKAVNPAGEGKV